MTTELDQQIEKCEELLHMFQKERQSYTEKQSVEIHDVLESMKQKQKIVEAFAMQEEFSKTPPQDETERKHLRRLGGLLEQLLVIEQENEILLSRLIKKSQQEPAKQSSGSSLVRNRPSLQQRLPFVPQKDTDATTGKLQRGNVVGQTQAFKPASRYI